MSFSAVPDTVTVGLLKSVPLAGWVIVGADGGARETDSVYSKEVMFPRVSYAIRVNVWSPSSRDTTLISQE